jgi:hypothetical protein
MIADASVLGATRTTTGLLQYACLGLYDRFPGPNPLFLRTPEHKCSVQPSFPCER